MFTELLLVLALLAGIAMLTAPALGHWLIREKIDTQARALLEMFSYARSEAMKRGVPITLCRYPAGRCQHVAVDNWACGYAVLEMSEGSQASQVLRIQSPVKDVVIRGYAMPLSFLPPAGQLRGGFRRFEISPRFDEGTIQKDQQMYRCIRIAMSGRARMVNGPCKAI